MEPLAFTTNNARPSSIRSWVAISVNRSVVTLSILAVGLALIYGFLLRFSIPLLPIIDADSGGYLAPAIDFYDRLELALLYGRSFPYPLFLGVILYFTKSFAMVSVIQHGIGLLTGILIFATFLRLANIARELNWLRNLLVASGAIVAVLFLFSPAEMIYEHMIRTESINPLFIVSVLYAQLALVHAFWERRTKSFMGWFAAVVVLNVFSYYFRPNVGFAILLGPLLALGLLWRYPISFGRKAAVLFASAIGVFALCIWPQRHFLQFREDSDRIRFLPIALLACHGQLLVPILEEDLRNQDYSIGTREQLEILRKVLVVAFDMHQRKEIAQYGLLGINPDIIMYGDLGTKDLYASLKTPEAFARFGYRYFARLLWRDPIGYLTKVRGQLSTVYGRHRGNPFIGEPKVDFAHHAKLSIQIAPTIWYSRTPRTEELIASYIRSKTEELTMLEKTLPPQHPFNINPVGDYVQQRLNIYYWWAVWLFPLMFITYFIAARFLLPESKMTSGLLALGSATTYLLLYNFLHCFAVAAVGSLEVGRYVQAQYVSFLYFLLLAGCWTSGLLLQIGLGLKGSLLRLLKLGRHNNSSAHSLENPQPERIAHAG